MASFYIFFLVLTNYSFEHQTERTHCCLTWASFTTLLRLHCSNSRTLPWRLGTTDISRLPFSIELTGSCDRTVHFRLLCVKLTAVLISLQSCKFYFPCFFHRFSHCVRPFSLCCNRSPLLPHIRPLDNHAFHSFQAVLRVRARARRLERTDRWRCSRRVRHRTVFAAALVDMRLE